jgi:hypothetical protein
MVQRAIRRWRGVILTWCSGSLVAMALATGAPGEEAFDDAPSRESRLASYTDLFAHYPEPVRAAYQAVLAQGRYTWSWTTAVVGRRERSVVRWDPSAPPGERFLLLEKDGRPATERERREFGRESERETRQSLRRRDEVVARNRALLAALQFEPIASEGDQVRYALRVGDFADDSFGLRDRIALRVLRAVSGEVVVDLRRPGFVELRLTLPERISPFPAVAIDELSFELRGRDDALAGTWLPEHVRFRLRGQYLLLGRLHEDTTVEIRDYRWIAQWNPPGLTGSP